MAFQAANLLPWRTAVDNVLLPLKSSSLPSRIGREKAAYHATARALLASVGLGGFTGKIPGNFPVACSNVQRICHALIHEPEILMFDEPFRRA